jgi:hypothetical protein
LKTAGLDDEFWPFAVIQATYIKNISPHKALPNNKTPFEVWYDRKPDINSIHNFGRIVYAVQPKPIVGKLSDRGIKCAYMGYSSTTKGHYLFDVEANRFFDSRNVFFPKECIYLSPSQKEPETLTNPAYNTQVVNRGIPVHRPVVSAAIVDVAEEIDSTSEEDECFFDPDNAESGSSQSSESENENPDENPQPLNISREIASLQNIQYKPSSRPRNKLQLLKEGAIPPFENALAAIENYLNLTNQP